MYKLSCEEKPVKVPETQLSIRPPTFAQYRLPYRALTTKLAIVSSNSSETVASHVLCRRRLSHA